MGSAGDDVEILCSLDRARRADWMVMRFDGLERER